MPPQKRVIKNRPKTEGEILDSKIEPSIPSMGKPPIHEYKRGNDTTVRGEEIKNISVGIEDIDTAILYYFNEVIKPYVINEGTKYDVPVMFADPEKWKSAQRDGGIRDKEGRIQFPVITLKKDNLERNRAITNKLDGNVVNIYNVYEKKYTRKNQYDNFSVLTNRAPVREFYNIVVPDYYTITYSCAVFVSYISDLNKIIEAIGFRADSYWGLPGRFLFKARVDSFPITSQIGDGEDRKIICNFTLTMNGYLTPSNIDRFLAADAFKFRGKTQILFTMETTGQDLEKISLPVQQNKVAKTSYIPEGVSVNTTIQSVNIIDTQIVAYLNISVTKKADIITSNTATFSNSSFAQPPSTSGLPATSVSDFKFFVNGVNVNGSSIISFQQVGANTVLKIDPVALGYSFDNLDDIIAIGKFQ